MLLPKSFQFGQLERVEILHDKPHLENLEFLRKNDTQSLLPWALQSS